MGMDWVVVLYLVYGLISTLYTLVVLWKDHDQRYSEYADEKGVSMGLKFLDAWWFVLSECMLNEASTAVFRAMVAHVLVVMNSFLVEASRRVMKTRQLLVSFVPVITFLFSPVLGLAILAVLLREAYKRSPIQRQGDLQQPMNETFYYVGFSRALVLMLATLLLFNVILILMPFSMERGSFPGGVLDSSWTTSVVLTPIMITLLFATDVTSLGKLPDDIEVEEDGISNAELSHTLNMMTFAMCGIVGGAIHFYNWKILLYDYGASMGEFVHDLSASRFAIYLAWNYALLWCVSSSWINFDSFLMLPASNRYAVQREGKLSLGDFASMFILGPTLHFSILAGVREHSLQEADARTRNRNKNR